MTRQSRYNETQLHLYANLNSEIRSDWLMEFVEEMGGERLCTLVTNAVEAEMQQVEGGIFGEHSSERLRALVRLRAAVAVVRVVVRAGVVAHRRGGHDRVRTARLQDRTGMSALDERSMVGRMFLGKIKRRSEEALGAGDGGKNVTLGNRDFLMVGDFCSC